MKSTTIVILGLLVMLGGCTATPYQKSGVTGGWAVKHLERDIYRVSFSGNGYTTGETVQAYWLYKCADLALEKGFDGFEILSHISLTQKVPAETLFSSEPLLRKAQMIFIPVDNIAKPEITADIRLLNEPLEGLPPKVFDAKKLKEAMNEYVEGEKCSMANVCEHVHKYIHPDGMFDDV